MKLSFLSWGFNGVRQTTAGNTHSWGVVRAAVKYVMTSLKLFSFPNVEKACSLLVKCWITIVALWKYVGEIWERIKEFQSDIKTLANLSIVAQEAR